MSVDRRGLGVRVLKNVTKCSKSDASDLIAALVAVAASTIATFYWVTLPLSAIAWLTVSMPCDCSCDATDISSTTL